MPSAIKFNIVGKPSKWVSGKDVILHIIGMIGVDGALYKSMEFVGEGIHNLSMDDRFTIANMAIEAGGKNGIFPVDDKAKAYMAEHSSRPWKVYEADEDAVYDEEYTIDLSTLRPTVAFPHLPENTRTIDEIQEDIAIDLNGDNLMITARHNSESGEKDEKGNYVRRERKFGSFSRSFDVSGIDTTAIKAAYNNGILELTLPKKGEVAPASRSIQIEG